VGSKSICVGILFKSHKKHSMEDCKCPAATPQSENPDVTVWDVVRTGDEVSFLQFVKNEALESQISEASFVQGKKDRQGNSLLHIAALFGQVDMIHCILDVLASSPDNLLASYVPVDSSNLTPLHFAASEGHLDCVEALVDRTKIPLDAVSKDIDVRLTGIPLYLSGGKTALHFAAEKGNLDIVQFLVEKKGFHPDVQDFDGTTPLALALVNNQIEVARYFDPNTQEVSSLFTFL
jgi:ankyrin repeat protein